MALTLKPWSTRSFTPYLEHNTGPAKNKAGHSGTSFNPSTQETGAGALWESEASLLHLVTHTHFLFIGMHGHLQNVLECSA